METDGDGEETTPAAGPRPGRRLADRLLVAFHTACDQAELDIAEQVLQVLEALVTRRPQTPDANRRRNLEALIAAHERLWYLRHPGAKADEPSL